MPFSVVIAWAVVGAVAAAPAKTDATRTAVVKGVGVLSAGATNYLDRRECFSCHHQALPLMVWESAARRGLPAAPGEVAAQADHTLAFFSKDANVKPRSTTTFPYALLGLKAAGRPKDAVTERLVEELLIRQLDDGSWPEKLDRPPAQGSLFTVTALAVEGVTHYAAEGQRDRAAAAARNGVAWLRRAVPKTTEDRAFRLRGLAHAGAAEAAAERSALLREQRVDGGWAQTAGDPESDAYATAVALNGLRAAGLDPGSVSYRKGVGYLLKAQSPEGAWVVQTRAKPVQVFFDNGDPGGQSQFLAVTATGWAVLALLETLPEAATP